MTLIPRLHLVELEDQRWFPDVLRDAGTAYLRKASELTGQGTQLAPKLAEALAASGETRVLDLCSGGSGPIPAMMPLLRESGIAASATLTDFYPNVASLRAIAEESGGAIDYVESPVDAREVPGELPGFRTLFNGFHHFRPEDARRILANAVGARRAIGVFEVIGRSPLAILGILFAPLIVLLVMPLVRPFRWQWLVFTYLIPLIPFFVLWDGLVSCLRVYTQDELRAMVAALDAPDYTWEIGAIKLRGSPVPATYLVGWPKVGESARTRPHST